MGVLDAVMQYKARKEAEAAQAANAIPQAVQAFIQGKQEAESNQLKMLAVNAELAGKGLRLTPQGIMRDDSLSSPLEQLVTQAKAAEAAKTMGNRQLWGALTGQNQMTQQPTQPMAQPQQPQGMGGVAQMVAPEIDPFTGKPTTAGVQQEATNKQIEQQMTAEQKMKVPTSKQKEDFDKISAAEVNVQNLEKQVDKLPDGYGGILMNTLNFVTRGDANPDLQTYNDSRPAVAVGLYRTLTGDTRLSDDDAKKRALPLLWDSSEAKSVQKKKFNNIKQMITARKEKIRNGQYTTTADGEFVTPLGSLVGAGGEAQSFTVGGKTYNIPSDQVEAFKKDMGIK